MRSLLICSLAVFCCTLGSAEDWPGFRGPHGNGTTAASNYPTTWSDSQNVAWSADLPRGGNGSPIVVGNHVLVTSAEVNKVMRGFSLMRR